MDLFSKARGLLAGRMSLPAAEPLRKLGKSYHAVAIEPGPRCCTLARSISDKRFLSTNAPPLPLKSCSRADCTCRYVHYADRRLGLRRAGDMGVCVDGYLEQDRRGQPFRGRRGIDR